MGRHCAGVTTGAAEVREARTAAGAAVVTVFLLAGACSPGSTSRVTAAESAPAPTPATTSPTPQHPPGAVPREGEMSDVRTPGAVPREGEVGRVRALGGLPPVVSSIPTERKVVFLTIDDGWEQDPGFVLQIRDQRIPITAFAMRDAVEARGVPDPAGGQGRYTGAGKWGYFRSLQDVGVPIENHTLTHPDLLRLSRAAQRQEICGASKLIAERTGARPTLFRPPFGSYNTDTLRAAKSCGLTSVLLWTASVQPGGKIAYQTPDKKLHPGDILLLHFRPNLDRDFRILIRKIKRRGFELGNLQAYLEAATSPRK